MAEIKTCEEYVLRELSNAEKKIDELERRIDVLKSTINDNNSILEEYSILKTLLANILENNETYISLFVSKSKEKEYNILKKYVNEPSTDSDFDKEK